MGAQDYTCFEEGPRYLVTVLADGVSTCPDSYEGAKVCCEALKAILFAKADYFFEFDTDKIKDLVMSHVLYELRKHVELKSGTIEDYSSTLAGVLYDKKEERYITLSVGDSLIVGSGFGKCEILSMPYDSTSGCPATTTNNVLEVTEVKISDSANYETITIFTDGAWRELYDRNNMKENVKSALISGDFKCIEDLLTTSEPFDDSSFITAILV